jgi:hypothetical protein
MQALVFFDNHFTEIFTVCTLLQYESKILFKVHIRVTGAAVYCILCTCKCSALSIPRTRTSRNIHMTPHKL